MTVKLRLDVAGITPRPVEEAGHAVMLQFRRLALSGK